MNRKDVSFMPLRRAVYSARTMASLYPGLYLPFARRKYRDVENRVVGPDTALVIEGYQRSGNTFSVTAFEMSQPRPVKTAHHLHAAAQIVAAVRMGVPALVLIRDPEESVLSHLVREPGVTPRQALSNWVRFYDRVAPLRDRVAIGEFQMVTADFGAVIREVNVIFGTGFVPFEHTEVNVARAFELMEERNRARHGAVAETTVPRPSPERELLKEARRAAYRAESLSGLRDRADALFRTLATSSSVS